MLVQVQYSSGRLALAFERNDARDTSRFEDCQARGKLHTLEAQASVTRTISDIHSAAGSIAA
jgi:hypothetical protein